jgi:hypothetical protein
MPLARNADSSDFASAFALTPGASWMKCMFGCARSPYAACIELCEVVMPSVTNGEAASWSTPITVSVRVVPVCWSSTWICVGGSFPSSK